ncbi:MAG TPA: protocatechuate 3,4-dioxygenase subunit alpha [Acetobacteraceae bacterium]|nr:protocatechuate 3,4-dioxygenase subunit alpha [Acetobacteraceae bacterium]
MQTATAQQTIGPYWHLLEDPSWADLTRFGATGTRIVLQGRILDGEAAPVNDACVELWQADPPASGSFPAFGRSGTDAEGLFRFRTLRPGAPRGRGDIAEAPHLALAIHARGLTRPLFTRVYFAGEALNETDPLLGRIDDPVRRASLVAGLVGTGVWEIDIRLRGARETVFLEF